MAREEQLESYITRNPKLRARTKHLYLLGVKSFLGFAGDNWSPETVEAWRSELLSNGIKPQTANIHLHAVKYASRKHAEKNSETAIDFASNITPLQVEPHHKKRPLKDAQQRDLIAACKGSSPIAKRDLALCMLGLRTGMRRSSMQALDIDDLTANTLTVTLKRGRKHKIELDAETADVLRAWIECLGAQNITSGALFRALSKPRRDGTVSVRGRMSQDGIYRACEARAISAGIHNFYPHVFHCTYLWNAKAAGTPMSEIKRVLGYQPKR